MLRRIVIGRHERGFLYRDPDYLRHLKPGAHWVWGWNRLVRTASTTQPRFEADDLDVFLADPAVREELVVADLDDLERAVVWVDGRVHAVLGKGRAAFWKGLHEVRLEVFDATSLRLEHPLLDAILAADGGRELLQVVVPKGARGLLLVNEELDAELGPGRYAFWRGVSRVAVEVVDLRETALDVTGQELLTADTVSLRLNLTAAYRVTEPLKSAEVAGGVGDALYRALQLALREAVGGRTLDALLAAKDEVAVEVGAAVEPRAAAVGAQLTAVGIKDVILPGEMKVLMNQVIEAEKRAKATLIQRREETAATRSLLNTAKLIESSPVLLRLKELEAAERIAGSIDRVQVVGGGIEGLIHQLLPRRPDA